MLYENSKKKKMTTLKKNIKVSLSLHLIVNRYYDGKK